MRLSDIGVGWSERVRAFLLRIKYFKKCQRILGEINKYDGERFIGISLGAKSGCWDLRIGNDNRLLRQRRWGG